MQVSCSYGTMEVYREETLSLRTASAHLCSAEKGTDSVIQPAA